VVVPSGAIVAVVSLEAIEEEASRAIVAATKAIVAAEAVVADVEEASLSLFTLDPPATASSCKFQIASRLSIQLCD